MKLFISLMLVIISGCLPANAASQEAMINQQKNVGKISEIKALIDLIDVKTWTDYRASQRLARQAFEALEQNPEPNLKARLLNLMAYGKFLADDVQGSYRDLLDARHLAVENGNMREEAESYRLEGNIMTFAGAYGEGMALYIKALEMHERINSNMIFDTIQGLSLPYLYTGDFEKYLEYGYKLLSRPEAEGQNRDKALAMYTVGHALIMLERYKEAKPYIEQAIDIFRSLNASYTSEAYTALAELDFREGAYDETLAIIEKSLAWSQQSGYQIADYLNYILKAKALVKMGREQQAIDEMQRLIKRSEIKEAKVGAWEQLALIYEAQGEFEQALGAFRQFKALTDSLYTDNNATKMALLQTRFESEQKEQQIITLQNQNKLQSLQTQRQQERSRLLSYINWLAIALVVILTFIIHHNIKVRKQLTRFAEDLQTANKAKSEFLANMSHEIRTPMNAILGMSLLALRTSLTVQQQDYISKINSSAKILLQVINDILDFSKIEAGKLDIERVAFSFDEVLQNVSNLIAEQADQKNIELIFSVAENLPKRLYGDPLRLGQVLTNLCSNAVKFTQHGEVIVSCSYTTDSDGTHNINISVKDTGIGLSKEQQQKLFKSFSQADASTTRRFGGTGLGLAISQQLVNMMGGSIYVDSELGKGSTFSFSIPIENSDDTAPVPEIPALLQDLNILVVDDNDNARTLMKSMLADFGFKVTMAENGEQCIKLVNQAQERGERYDLILMDWRMPGMDGFEAAKVLNHRRGMAQIPAVLMVTSYGRDEVMRMDQEKVLKGFIMKPVTPTALLDAIKSALGVSQSLPHSKSLAQVKLKQQQDQALIEKVKRVSGARILLVEDNELNQQVASELLEQAGMLVEHALNGKEAVDMARHNDHYDLIFMDIQMPQMDGYEATRTLRSFEEFTDMPIIAMTAHAMQGERERCEEAGMNDYLTKPIEPELLHELLVKWIKPADRQPVEISLKPESSLLDITADNGNVVLPAVLDGIDIRLGLKRTGNKPSLYIDLANTFLKQYKNAGQQFKTMLIQRDFEATHRLAHIMQAGAGSIGAEKLRKQLIKIVELADSKTLNSQHMFDFYREMNRVFESIGKLPEVKKNGASQKRWQSKTGNYADIDVAKVESLVAQLRSSLDEGAFDAKDQLNQLIEALSGHHMEITGNMSELLDDYEFIQAQSLLDKLSDDLRQKG